MNDESRLASVGNDDLSRGDGLANVALGVIGNVDQQPADGGWKLLLAYMAWVLKLLRREGPDPFAAVVELRRQLCKQLFFGCAGLQLRLKRGYLFAG